MEHLSVRSDEISKGTETSSKSSVQACPVKRDEPEAVPSAPQRYVSPFVYLNPSTWFAGLPIGADR
jgi:hypothetical protein